MEGSVSCVNGGSRVIKRLRVVLATVTQKEGLREEVLNSHVGLQLHVVRQAARTCTLNRSDLWLQRVPREREYRCAMQLGVLRCMVL